MRVVSVQAGALHEISEPSVWKIMEIIVTLVRALQKEPASHSSIEAIFPKRASADHSQVITNMNTLVWTLD